MGEENIEKCPRVQEINEDLLNLTYNEKLKAFEEEAKSLYAFCINKGFSEQQMIACVSKLHGPAKSRTKQALNDSFGSLMFISFLVAVCAFVCASSSAQDMITIHFKIATIKFVIPYWDYGAWYNEECLINNNWLPEPKPKKVTNKTCKYCSSIVELNNNTLDRLTNALPDNILKFYILNQQPVVVTDVTKDWNTLKQLTMDELGDLFQNNQFFQTYMGSCEYKTNVGFNETFYDFITAYVDKKLPEKWHINWLNCEIKAAKIIRKYCKRPYYLPQMAQGHSFNSIIAAKGNQSGTVFNMFHEEGSGRWLTVVSGELLFYLSPIHEECLSKFDCKVVQQTLKAGESMLFFPDFWTFEYTVTGDDMTIAVMSSLIWDKM